MSILHTNRSAKTPRITVVTPSFNQGKFLEETISSVIDQRYPNLEYIVIDGGSTDDSVEVIRHYEKHLTYWVSEKDYGQTHAINKGFARATGQIFAYLNSDDVYPSGLFDYLADKYRSACNPKKFFHACTVEEFDHTGMRGYVRPQAQNRLVDWIEYRAYLHQPGVFWSKELHHVVGGFDESYCYAFDRKFFMQAIAAGYRVSVDRDRVGARFRRHPASKTESVAEQGLGFAPEFIRISQEMLGDMSFPARQMLKISSFISRQERLSTELIYSTEAPPHLLRLLRAGLIYPPQLCSRYYLGALKRSIGLAHCAE